MAHIIVFSTCARKTEATKIAKELLKRRLAACVNIMPITSFYWWERRIAHGCEYLLLIKTRAQLFAKVRERILESNGYEVPEIVSVRIDNGLPAYLKWIDRETGTR